MANVGIKIYTSKMINKKSFWGVVFLFYQDAFSRYFSLDSRQTN